MFSLIALNVQKKDFSMSLTPVTIRFILLKIVFPGIISKAAPNSYVCQHLFLESSTKEKFEQTFESNLGTRFFSKNLDQAIVLKVF